MASDGAQIVAWLQSVIHYVNGNPRFELENKFASRFQGIVSEDPADFDVGVEPQCYQDLVAHFDKTVADGKLTRSVKTETLQYLSNHAYEMCGEQIQSCTLMNQHGKSVRIVLTPNHPRVVLIKTRLPLPGGKADVFPEGFKMSLSDERIIDVESDDYWAKDGMQVLNLFDVLPPQVIVSRHKERVSYVQHILDKDNNSIPVIRFDFTITTTTTPAMMENDEQDDLAATTNNNKCRYEIEMEYIGNKNEDGGTATIQSSPDMMARIAKLYLDCTRRLLCLIQGSDVLLNVAQHNKVICRYMEMVGITDSDDPYRDYKFKVGGSDRSLFVGCQPESLHERHLTQLVRDSYFVLDKTDGQRYLLMAMPVASPTPPREGASPSVTLHCYLLNRWLHVQKAGISITFPLNESTDLIASGFLLDGELLEPINGVSRYMSFDVLWASHDIRPKMTFRRLELLKQIVDVVSKSSAKKSPYARIPLLKVEMKHILHWPRNQARAGDLIREMLNREYAVDGLIFTPDMPYPNVPKWPQLLKWKGTQSTVDLFVRKNVKANRWDLYVSGNFATVTRDQSRCLIFKRVPEEESIVTKESSARFSKSVCYYWVVNMNGLIVQHPSRDLRWAKMRSPVLFPFMPFLSIGTELEDGMVYEFIWDLASNRLMPLCKRVDKSLQGINGANDLTVAVDVWESMRYPVTKEQLMALPNIGRRASDRSLGNYPYSHDIYPDFDWRAIFEGRAADSKNNTDASAREQQALRRMHNRIKEQVIKKATHNTRHVSDAQRLINLGGVILANAREDSTQLNVRSPCWSIPNTPSVRKTLEVEWGVQIEDCGVYGDRIHIYENVLKQHQAQLSVTENAKTIVDICCGRGGDLKKYVNQKVQVVVGIDNVPDLLYLNKDAALKRWAKDYMGGAEQSPDMDVCFVLADVRQPLYNILEKRGIPLEADVISCFFAIHYFFTTELDARSFFQNVKDLLKPDGFFIGTIIDGELMYEKLKQTNNVYRRDDPYDPVELFVVESGNFDATQTAFTDLPDFGTSINVFIRSSILEEYVNEPEKDGRLKQENLVKFDTLVAMAADFDLEFQGSQTFDQYFPDIPYIQLSEPVARFSAVHRTFCFRKISKSKDNGKHSRQDIRQSVHTLQQQQFYSGVVEDDRESNSFAYNAAYPDDAIVRTVFVTPDDDQPEMMSIDEEQEEEEEQKQEEEEEQQEEQQQEEEKQEEPPVKEEEPVAKKIRSFCTERCANGGCKYCLCKRTLKQKCTDQCGCGPNCTNR